MRIITLIFAVGFALSALAQTPEAFTYQAVARALDGTPLTDQSIGIRVNIRTDSLNGAAVYTETHTANSNAYGVFTLNVGKGVAEVGDFSMIDWGASSHFLNVEMDPAGGTNYQDMGSTQIMSVPYALFSKTSSYDLGQEVRLDAADQALTDHDDNLDELLALINFYHPFICGEPLIDVRDGNVYNTTEVGGVCWMAENLNFDVDASGGSASDGTGPNHVDSVGRYYSWAGALDIDLIYNNSLYNNFPSGNVRGVCPIGWHIPQHTEWIAMYNATTFGINGELAVGGSSGMDIQLAGKRFPITQSGFIDVGAIAYPGARDEQSAINRREMQIFSTGGTFSTTNKGRMLNMRCVQD